MDIHHFVGLVIYWPIIGASLDIHHFVGLVIYWPIIGASLDIHHFVGLVIYWPIIGAAVVRWIHHSPCKPVIAGSFPGFSSLSA